MLVVGPCADCCSITMCVHYKPVTGCSPSQPQVKEAGKVCDRNEILFQRRHKLPHLLHGAVLNHDAAWFKIDRLEISSTFAKENTATLKQNRPNA